MKITEEQEEIIVNFGVFDYDPQKMANILGCKLEEVKAEIKDANSLFSKLLQRGKDMGDYVIDSKLFSMAQSGDMKALGRLNQRKLMRKKHQ